MKLEFLLEGSAFTLYAIVQGENVVEYLEELEQNNVQAHAQIARRLLQLAERGPSRKKDEFNDLGHELYEAKAKKGPRVIFFYDENRLIICSHAFDKQGQKTPKREIETAVSRKRNYFACKQAGFGFGILRDEKQAEPRRQP
ncbi:MAG: type II toxin-antitoxin system RelE/ParE family toxin [bacterium]